MQSGEVFSTGFWMTGIGTPSQANATALAGQMWLEGFGSTAPLGGLYTSLSILLASPAVVDTVMVYEYEGTSNVASFTGSYTSATPFYGQQPVTQPNQVGCVVSLRTGLPGRRNRGRMYLPATAAVLDSTGQFKSANVDTIGQAMSQMFSRINATTYGKVAVMSSTGSVAHPVSATIVDSRADIQRRRANREIITYSHTDSVVL